MAWHLNEDISFCELDGRFFFLDIQRDRYFQLPETLERRFRKHLNNPDDADVDVSGLARHNLLLQTSKQLREKFGSELGPVFQSVIESPQFKGLLHPSVIRDVFLTVAAMHWQLRTRPLKNILEGLHQYRCIRTSPSSTEEAEIEQHVGEYAAAFIRVRPYVPIETRCLIDSLSLVRFLAKRGLHSYLVMGMASDPFSAHAWVQRGSLALNETVGTAHAHVPIRVI